MRKSSIFTEKILEKQIFIKKAFLEVYGRFFQNGRLMKFFQRKTQPDSVGPYKNHLNLFACMKYYPM